MKLALLAVAAIISFAVTYYVIREMSDDSRKMGLPNVEPEPDEGAGWAWPTIGSAGTGTGDVPMYLAGCGHFHPWGISCSSTASGM